MLGYKGFDKDFRCRGFQYRVGETYHFDGEIEMCERGFHFCDTPLAVWHFYQPADSRFALVEATGNIISDKGRPEKFCTDTLHIVKELSLDELIKIVEKEYANNQKANTGCHSAATNTGDESAATNTGCHSAATNTGDESAAVVSGEKSLAVAFGRNSRAKGSLGCWIVLAEWRDNQPFDVKAFNVDGQTIKPDTFYTLKDGVPVEYEEAD